MLTLKQFRKLTRGLKQETPIEFLNSDYTSSSHSIEASNVSIKTQNITTHTETFPNQEIKTEQKIIFIS